MGLIQNASRDGSFVIALGYLQCLLVVSSPLLLGHLCDLGFQCESMIGVENAFYLKLFYPPVSKASGEFRNFTRLAVFSGCLSVCDILVWMGLSNF